MAVRYRFKSETTFSSIFLNGMSISVSDVKKEIYQQRKLGRSENVDLMISNAENGEKFIDDSTLIPKNTSLIVLRVPSQITSNSKHKKFNKFLQTQELPIPIKTPPKSLHTDLTTMRGTEEEKIFAMMMQSTFDYNNNIQANLTKFLQPPPSTYICHRCHMPGHWIQKCSLNPKKSQRFDPTARMTGIPKSMRNRKIDDVKVEKVLNKEICENYFCENCKEIFRNPTVTPCCKSTFCYDCIESELLQSDEHECPKCGEKYLMLSQLEANEEMKMEIKEIYC